MSVPLSSSHAAWLMVRLRYRRMLSQFQAVSRRKSRAPASGMRTATAGKSGPRWLFLALIAVGMATSFGRLAATTVASTHRAFEAHPDRALLYLTANLTILMVAALIMPMGNREFSAPEWDLEWLITLPVSTRALGAMRWLERTVANPLGLMTIWPLLLMVGWPTSRWPAIGLSLLLCVLLLGVSAAAQLAIETALRMTLSPPKLRNLQALFTVLGVLTLYAAMAPGLRHGAPLPLAGVMLPSWLAWTPPGLAMRIMRGEAGTPGCWMLLAAQVASAAAAAVAVFTWQLRGGVVTGGGRESGRPSSKQALPTSFDPGAQIPRERAPLFTAVQRRELRLLRRDRNFLVQTLAMPVVFLGAQFFLVHSPGGEFWRALADAPGTLSAIAFGIAAYALMFSALQTLNAEGGALWILFSVPLGLEKVVAQKARLWCAISLVYPAALFALVLSRSGRITAALVADAGLVLIGIPVFAVAASALGVLAADPLAEQVQRRVRPSVAYFYMALAGVYGYAIASGGLRTRAVCLVLIGLVSFALWQRAREHLPFLLDPTAAPPAAVSLSDGMVAALLFFVAQVVAFAFVGQWNVAGLNPLLLAFVIAGATTFAVMRWSFWRSGATGVPRWWGSRPGHDAAIGAAAGLVCACVGVAYVMVMKSDPRFTSSSPSPAHALGMLGFAALAILAAPLFEEFIFRGLIFGGLRRTTHAAIATLASAALFALVHPPMAFPPVFVMGLTCAWLYERRKTLLPAVVTHATYNAAIIAVQLLFARG